MTDNPISGQAMTRPEPAGVGTAEDIARQLDATIHADAAEYHADFRRLVDAAITAAESRAMERCAKIADVWATIPGDNDWCAGQRLAGSTIAETIRDKPNA